MRLLKYEGPGNLVLHTFNRNYTPPYAILSHTWLADDSQEVSFQDMEAGRAVSKPGYDKIWRFSE